MEINRMLGTEEAVVVGTEGGPGPTGVPTTTAIPAGAKIEHGRRFERFAEVGEDLPDRSGLRDKRDQPDVAAAGWALERKLLPHPGHQLRPRNPGGVVRAGFCVSVAAAIRNAGIARMPAGRGLAPLADIPDSEPGHGRPEPVIRRKHPMVAMPMLPRRRHEIGEPVEKLKR